MKSIKSIAELSTAELMAEQRARMSPMHGEPLSGPFGHAYWMVWPETLYACPRFADGTHDLANAGPVAEWECDPNAPDVQIAVLAWAKAAFALRDILSFCADGDGLPQELTDAGYKALKDAEAA